MARRDEGGDVRLYVLALAALPRQHIVSRLAWLRRHGKISEAKQRSVARSLIPRGGVREFNKEVILEMTRQNGASRARRSNRRGLDCEYSAKGEYYISLDYTCNEDDAYRSPNGIKRNQRMLVRRRLILAQGSLAEVWNKCKKIPGGKAKRSRSKEVSFEPRHVRAIDGKMVALVVPRIQWQDQDPIVIRQDSMNPPRLSVAKWAPKKARLGDRIIKKLEWHPLEPPATVGDTYPEVAAQIRRAFAGCNEVMTILEKPAAYAEAMAYAMAKGIGPFYYTAEDVLDVLDGSADGSVLDALRKVVERKCAYDAYCALINFQEGESLLKSRLFEDG